MIVLTERHERLALGGIAGPIELADGTLIRRQPGVLLFHDIPQGVLVRANVSRPNDVSEVPDGGAGVGSVAAGVSQPYRFEVAVGPATVTLPGGATQRALKPILIPPTAATGGPTRRYQEVPSYVPFGPVVEGDLVQYGRAEHAFATPSPVADINRGLVRMRWTGTVVAAANLVTGLVAATEAEGSLWASSHDRLVPGSIVVTLPSGGTLRDDGTGLLVGSDGDGFGYVDYSTGAWKLYFYQAETGDVTVDYEHGCPYEALNVHLAWDSLLQ